MDIETVSSKHSMQLEQQITELLRTIRKAKLNGHPIYGALQDLEQELGEARRSRFDKGNSEYSGY